MVLDRPHGENVRFAPPARKASVRVRRLEGTTTSGAPTVVRSIRLLVLCVLAFGCSSQGDKCCLVGAGGRSGNGGQGGGGNSPTTQVTLTFGQTVNNKVDILFVIDNWASTTAWQQKLLQQLPTFVQVLKNAPIAIDLHIAVADTDMGAPSDVQMSLGVCIPPGDDGAFQYAAQGTCTGTTLAAGATYLADDGHGTTNFTDPMGTVLQCIGLLEGTGCGFGQPLAAAVHALGADNIQAGTPTPPPTNIGFLRPDAYLAIIFLANEDDCSAPASTELFSLNGGQQNLANPLGPISHYRCNRYGHLCNDPSSANPTAFISPPLTPPSDAQGTAAAPTLNLTGCKDNDTATGFLTPVSDLVSDIKALKADPDDQILVAGIIVSPTPYAVAWFPEQEGENTQPGELWPEVMHACGAQGGDDVNPAGSFTTDGSFGDPGLRESQFLKAFPNSVQASLCDPSYAASTTAIATKISQFPGPPCITGEIQRKADGELNCTGSAAVQNASGVSQTETYPNCADTQNAAPCFSMVSGTGSCVGSSVQVNDAPGAPHSSFTVSCQACNPGASVAGC
jgi:hypothetical protein